MECISVIITIPTLAGEIVRSFFFSSLFIVVLTGEALGLLSPHFDEDV
jgi:hypothetical protein